MIIFRFNLTKEFASGHLFRAVNLYNTILKYSDKIPKDKIFFFINTDEFARKYRKFLKNKICFAFKDLNYEYSMLDMIAQTITQKKKIIILDVKDTSETYINFLKRYNFKIIGFDDTGPGSKFLDFLIDANIHKISKKSNQLFGPKYILLAPIFSEYNKQEKKISEKIKKGLLFFGGADNNRIAEFIMNNIDKLNFKDCSLRIITNLDIKRNPNYPRIRIIKKMVAPEEIAKLYYDYDFAIISGGISIYESMCCGCPSIVINQNAEQNKNVSYYNEQLINIGVFNAETAVEQLNTAFVKISDVAERKKLSDLSKKTIDGFGYMRIIKVLEKIIDE